MQIQLLPQLILPMVVVIRMQKLLNPKVKTKLQTRTENQDPALLKVHVPALDLNLDQRSLVRGENLARARDLARDRAQRNLVHTRDPGRGPVNRALVQDPLHDLHVAQEASPEVLTVTHIDSGEVEVVAIGHARALHVAVEDSAGHVVVIERAEVLVTTDAGVVDQ